MGASDIETFLLVKWREIVLSRWTFGHISNSIKNMAKEEFSQIRAGPKVCILLCEVMKPVLVNVYRQNDYQLKFSQRHNLEWTGSLASF